MVKDKKPKEKLKVVNPNNSKSLLSSATLNLNSWLSYIPKKFAHILDLEPIDIYINNTFYDSVKDKMTLYRVNLEINNRSKMEYVIVGLDDSKKVSLGFDVLYGTEILPFFDMIPWAGMAGLTIKYGRELPFIGSIADFKYKTVIIIGEDTLHIDRLQKIKHRLKEHKFESIIIKELKDIEIQSIEEKFNMYASLSKFVICDNSFSSGHIDELKICSINRFVTAIIQEKGRGATWMQTGYRIDYSFMEEFIYKDVNSIERAVDRAVIWAERKVRQRQNFLNKIYKWR